MSVIGANDGVDESSERERITVHRVRRSARTIAVGTHSCRVDRARQRRGARYRSVRV